MTSRVTRALPVLCLTWAAAAVLPAATGPWSENPQSSVRLVTPWEVAPASGDIRLGLHFRVIPGWHVYWKNSGDAGFPPIVDFAPTPAIRRAELLFPAPRRYDLPGGLVAFGYETEVVYPIAAVWEVSGDERTTARIGADLDYLVCEIDCIPYSYRLEVDQPVGAAPRPDSVTASLLDQWWSRVPVPADGIEGLEHRSRLVLGAEPRLTIDLLGSMAEPQALALFFEPHELFELGRPRVEPLDGGARLTVDLTRRDASRPLPRTVPFAWTVTGLAGTPAAVELREVLEATDQAPRPASRAGWPAAALAVAGGALRLLPAPSVAALFLVVLLGWRRLDAPRALRRRAGGALLLLAVLDAALATGGALATDYRPTWGTQLQTPVALALFAGLLLALAVRWWRGGGTEPLAAPQTVALLVLVALPWSPAGLSGAVARGLAAGVVPATLTSLAFTAGLGLPLLAVLAAPRLLLALPPAWAGAAWVRRVAGFGLATTLVWLLYLLSKSVARPYLAGGQLGLLLTAAAVFFWPPGRVRGWRPVILVGTALAGIVATAWLIAAGS